MKLKTLAPWKESYEKPRQHIEKQRHHFSDKGLYSQSYGFSSSHVRMRELDHREGWAPKNWWFWIVLNKTLESPLDCKIKSVSPKRNQPWIFIGRTNAEAAILWPPDVKNQLFGKDLDAGKDWRQEEKGATEDEMVGWHHQLNSHEFKQTLVERGQRSLVCFSYGVTKSWTQLSNQTTNIIDLLMYFLLLDPRVCLYIPSI